MVKNKSNFKKTKLNQLLFPETVIKPSLNEFSEILTKTLTNDTIQYKHHTKRLETVRKEKANRIEFPDEQDVDDCDMFSDTSSVNTSRYSTSSRGTGKTFRSSKNRRKHERKLLSLKEGNPFEDIALIDALFVLIHKILEQQNLVRDICLALIELNLIEGGVQLQVCFFPSFFLIRFLCFFLLPGNLSQFYKHNKNFIG